MKRGMQKGCGKCKNCTSSRRCRHGKQRGGCGACAGGGWKKSKQMGGCGACSGGQVGGKKTKSKQRGGTGGSVGIIDNISNLRADIFTNVFRGFNTQPPIPYPSF
jgi:hypothetical protein